MYCKYDESQWVSEDGYQSEMRKRLIDGILEMIPEEASDVNISLIRNHVETCWQITGIEFDEDEIVKEISHII